MKYLPSTHVRQEVQFTINHTNLDFIDNSINNLITNRASKFKA